MFSSSGLHWLSPLSSPWPTKRCLFAGHRRDPSLLRCRSRYKRRALLIPENQKQSIDNKSHSHTNKKTEGDEKLKDTGETKLIKRREKEREHKNHYFKKSLLPWIKGNFELQKATTFIVPFATPATEDFAFSKTDRRQRGMTPSFSDEERDPSIVKVFPVPVCPYAKIVQL